MGNNLCMIWNNNTWNTIDHTLIANMLCPVVILTHWTAFFKTDDFICKILSSLQTADPSGWSTTFAQICDKWSESFTNKYFCVILQSLCPVIKG